MGERVKANTINEMQQSLSPYLVVSSNDGKEHSHWGQHDDLGVCPRQTHGWFDAPRDKRIEARLKAVLSVFGCDPKLFTYSQPVRVPGAFRDGR